MKSLTKNKIPIFVKKLIQILNVRSFAHLGSKACAYYFMAARIKKLSNFQCHCFD